MTHKPVTMETVHITEQMRRAHDSKPQVRWGWTVAFFRQLVNARRECARELQYSLCVCLEFAAFISRLHTKYDILVYFSPVLLGL